MAELIDRETLEESVRLLKKAVANGDVQAAKELVQLRVRMGPQKSDGVFGEVSAMDDATLLGAVLDAAMAMGNDPLLVVADHRGGPLLRNAVARTMRQARVEFREWRQ